MDLLVVRETREVPLRPSYECTELMVRLTREVCRRAVS